MGSKATNFISLPLALTKNNLTESESLRTIQSPSIPLNHIIYYLGSIDYYYMSELNLIKTVAKTL